MGVKVRRVTPVKLGAAVPVYDLTVHNTHNFCLSNGAVVHNSNDISDALAGVVYGLTCRKEIWLRHNLNPSFIPMSVQEAVKKDSIKDADPEVSEDDE